MAPENMAADATGAMAAGSFNEAGAHGPGKRVGLDTQGHHLVKASMRPGHMAPENAVGDGMQERIRRASMRPGHMAPENLMLGLGLFGAEVGFNEAGAHGPGKRPSPCRPRRFPPKLQ